MPAVEFQSVDIVFGNEPQAALDLIDQGADRDAVLEQTGQVVGVTGASLAVEHGETCVLMGLSGSGKSTLLRSVNGLNRVTRGRVLVEDGEEPVDVTGCSRERLRALRMNTVSMVFQQFALLPWRTVAENVGFGLELKGLRGAERDERIARSLELVGLERWADKRTHELSGGMQQRVGLARAFATDAEILLMDEPFSALDPLIRSRLQDELLELQRRLRKTIVFVSHDLDEALKIGSRIAIMESARVVQYAVPEAIVLSPASRYVADFVAHMNPLNVLTGGSLMRPADALERAGAGVRVDPRGRVELLLGAGGRPDGVRVDGHDATLHSLGDGEVPAGGEVVAAAGPQVAMRTVIELRHQTGNPVVLVDGDQLVGVVGDEEIYRGMLRQSTLAEDAP